jgi:hypothetical protein
MFILSSRNEVNSDYFPTLTYTFPNF